MFTRLSIVIVSAAAALFAAPFQANQADVRILYAPATLRAFLHEPIFIRVIVENTSGESAIADVSMNDDGYGSFKAKLVRPDGLTEEAPAPRLHQAVAIERISIAPGESRGAVLLANKWFDFDSPGRYTLSVEWLRPIQTASGGKLMDPPAGTILIDIAPRDREGLQKLCADLESEISNSNIVRDRLEAAATLSRITDPVAVPFLSRILKDNDRLAPQIVAGLQRIADSTAVDALIAEANSQSGDTRALVRAALARIERESDDVAIRQKITAARQTQLRP